MSDEIILKLINSSPQDLVLGMNYLAEKSLLEILEFFNTYAEDKTRKYDYLLYPRLITISIRGEMTSYISKFEYELIHYSCTLQLCMPKSLEEYHPKFIKL